MKTQITIPINVLKTLTSIKQPSGRLIFQGTRITAHSGGFTIDYIRPVEEKQK